MLFCNIIIIVRKKSCEFKMKVFNKLSFQLSTILSSMCSNINHSREADEGEYATLKTTTQLQISEYDEVINLQQRMHHHHHDNVDGASEDGKLLECVQNESVTYASTRDLEPPQTAATSVYSHERYIVTSEHHMMSPMAPVTVQVHTENLVSLFLLKLRDK